MVKHQSVATDSNPRQRMDPVFTSVIIEASRMATSECRFSAAKPLENRLRRSCCSLSHFSAVDPMSAVDPTVGRMETGDSMDAVDSTDDRRAVARPANNEFHYAPVSPMAPIAAFLGVVSLLALLSYLFVPVAFFGAVLSLFAIR